MDKIKVRFVKAIYPYNEGDIGYLTPERAEYNKDYVEVVQEEKQNKMVTSEKATKKSTK